MRPFKRAFLVTLFFTLTLSAAFLAGFGLREALGVAGIWGQSKTNFPLLQQAYQIINENGLSPLPTSPAPEYGMIRGLIQAYGDPHTAFLEPVQAELESNNLQGKFGGIGVRLGKDADGFPVLFPYPDSPAVQAGVKEGDRLLSIDDKKVDLDTPDDAIQAAIRGPVNQVVTLTVARAPDFAPQQVRVKRTEIALPSVTWHLEPAEPRLGVIEINIIAASTPDEIQKAVADLQSRGATHFALDLRNNGGGLLEAGVDTARLFLKEGEIIKQQYRGEKEETYQVERVGALAGLPLVIFINQNTASAAEIIAGALQSHQCALLIGSTTYGKDTIQLVFSLSDGSSLHVTAAHWWIPGMDFPQEGHGLEPDVAVPVENTDPRAPIQAAIQALFPQ